MKFESRVREALSNLRTGGDSRVVVDSTRVLTGQDLSGEDSSGEDECVVMVSYHVEGRLASASQFTFPFVESVPLDESIEAFLDYGARSWANAEFAPGEVPPGYATSHSAGAD